MTEPRIYRASSLGYSLEQLVAGHLGYAPIDPPEWLQEKFDEGSALEPVVLAEMEANDWHLVTTQPEVNSEGDHQIEVLLEVVPGVATVRGHLDATGRYIFSGDEEERVVEVKSMADKSFQDFCRLGWDMPGLIQKYKWQISAYMLASGMGAVLAACSKERDDKGQLQLRYLYVDEPFYTISDIANKLQMAEDHIEKGLVPEGCTDYPCPYFYLHSPDDTPTESADEQLEPLLTAWLEADRKEKVYKKEKDALRDMIVEFIGNEGAAKVQGSNGVTVSVSWQDGGEVVQKRQPKWVTRITGPRGKNATK